jgi:Flp pilus assembly pilin Flp
MPEADQDDFNFDRAEGLGMAINRAVLQWALDEQGSPDIEVGLVVAAMTISMAAALRQMPAIGRLQTTDLVVEALRASTAVRL